MKSNWNSKTGGAPKEQEYLLWESMSFPSSETQKIILIIPLPYSGIWQEECWDSLDYLTTAMWSTRHVILQSGLKKKKSYVNSVITALTGIKTICSICFISHQPLLMSPQQEVKRTKMFIPLCPMELKYLKTFTLNMQRNSGVETIEINTQS